MRQIVLDTETTGLRHQDGHRIIEIGCVELVNRKLTGEVYHQYIQPERDIDAGALAVHGITDEFLADKPVFAEVMKAFLDFVQDDELVIHNAPFDIGFLNAEFALCDGRTMPIDTRCDVTDTLKMARRKHPGQRNSLDALCQRYHVDRSKRELHGALLDAELLARVYLALTGGQGSLFGGDAAVGVEKAASSMRVSVPQADDWLVLPTTQEEQAAHQAWLARLKKEAGQHYFDDVASS